MKKGDILNNRESIQKQNQTTATAEKEMWAFTSTRRNLALILIKEVEISLTSRNQEFSEGKNNLRLKNEDSGIMEGGKKSQILKVNFLQNSFAPYSQMSKNLNTSAVKTYIYGGMQNGALNFYIRI